MSLVRLLLEVVAEVWDALDDVLAFDPVVKVEDVPVELVTALVLVAALDDGFDWFWVGVVVCAEIELFVLVVVEGEDCCVVKSLFFWVVSSFAVVVLLEEYEVVSWYEVVWEFDLVVVSVLVEFVIWVVSDWASEVLWAVVVDLVASVNVDLVVDWVDSDEPAVVATVSLLVVVSLDDAYDVVEAVDEIVCDVTVSLGLTVVVLTAVVREEFKVELLPISVVTYLFVVS